MEEKRRICRICTFFERGMDLESKPWSLSSLGCHVWLHWPEPKHSHHYSENSATLLSLTSQSRFEDVITVVKEFSKLWSATHKCLLFSLGIKSEKEKNKNMRVKDLVFSLKAETTQKEMPSTTKKFIRTFRNSGIFNMNTLTVLRVGQLPNFSNSFCFQLKK